MKVGSRVTEKANPEAREAATEAGTAEGGTTDGAMPKEEVARPILCSECKLIHIPGTQKQMPDPDGTACVQSKCRTDRQAILKNGRR